MIHQINNYIFLLSRSKPKNPIPSSHQLKLKHQTHLKRREKKKIPIMSSYGVTFPLILLFLLFSNVISYSDASTSVAQANGSLTSNDMSSFMEPEKVVEMRLMMNESRRKLSGFQICALCTCCGGAKGLCLPSPCCYAINCNIPNRPFGFCSFTPKTCNCFGCHI